MLAYVRKKGLTETVAADVVQEVLARLVKALPDFELKRESGRFRTWLWRVTYGALADWGRRQRRRADAERPGPRPTPPSRWKRGLRGRPEAGDAG